MSSLLLREGAGPASPDLTFNGYEDAFVAKISSWESDKHAVGDVDGDGKDEVAVDFGAVRPNYLRFSGKGKPQWTWRPFPRYHAADKDARWSPISQAG